MRADFADELRQVNDLLVAMSGSVRDAMGRATRALLDADAATAEAVIAHDATIDERHQLVEETVYDLLARQQPVAGDLRIVITALHVAGNLERMGDLAQHVAKIALLRHPEPALHSEARDIVQAMASVAESIAAKVTAVLANRNVSLAAELERDDDAIDGLQRGLFALLVDGWPHGVEGAVDTALLGRFYERYADHAVNAGRQVIYLVTGTTAE